MRKRLFFMFFLEFTVISFWVSAQSATTGVITGKVYDKSTNQPVPFANLVIWQTNIGTVSDIDGNFSFAGIKPGYVQIVASSVGYEQYLSEEFLVTNAHKSFVDIQLAQSKIAIDSIVVKASAFRKSEESPVSLRRIGIEQIEKSPGGNRDISKVIQTLPGVASTPSFRNDVIVRGGGPNENSFLLDGVEIPNLNHFATQGASGGPVGLINVDFIREVNFYSGAFPASIGNTMSSVLDMRQIDGSSDHYKYKASVGASDLSFTIDGPLGEKASLIASVRRSYLQFLFSALELPFLPTYNDFQMKTRIKLDEKNEITILALGAYDQSDLNLSANETPSQKYILSYLPTYNQWNYTFGAVYNHFRKNGYDTWVLSRNFLNNSSYKYFDNTEINPKTLDYSSTEGEDKFRFERLLNTKSQYRINFGVSAVYARYSNETYKAYYIGDSLGSISYNSALEMFHYGAFGQLSKRYFDQRLVLSLGLRADGSNYSSAMSNPLQQLSPRFSASYALLPRFSVNMNTGRYFERPPYTSMGFENNEGITINKSNGLTYITSDHFVMGVTFNPNEKSQLSVESFYKAYSNYPFSVNDSVPLATKGSDFGTFGDEELVPNAEGRAYGFEILGRSQHLLGINAVLSYTFVRSEFKDQRSGHEGNYLPTLWDNRHLLNLTATRTFKKGWYAGFKWRYVGGAPYTAYDFEKSSIKSAWDAQGGPYLDYSRFNNLRLHSFHQLNIRIDKQYYFTNWSLNFYIDIQNLYNFKAEQPDYLVRKSFVEPGYNDVYTDAKGIERYELEYIPGNGGGTILPTVGVIVEF